MIREKHEQTRRHELSGLIISIHCSFERFIYSDPILYSYHQSVQSKYLHRQQSILQFAYLTTLQLIREYAKEDPNGTKLLKAEYPFQEAH